MFSGCIFDVLYHVSRRVFDTFGCKLSPKNDGIFWEFSNFEVSHPQLNASVIRRKTVKKSICLSLGYESKKVAAFIQPAV
jgi:hypothetical protein